MALVRVSEALGQSCALWTASVGALDGAYTVLSDLVGAPVDYVKLFSLLLGALPLAAPLPYLPTSVKHSANIVVTWFFMGPVLHLYGGYAQLVGSAAATYAIVKYNVGGRRMPWLVMFFQMGHLLINHVIRQFGNVPLTTMEITSMQMVLVMNLTTFAWDCYDGQRRPIEDLDVWQRKARITQMPSLLEFFGYVFYFPGVLIGPATRFVDYKAWADDHFYTEAPSGPVPQSWGPKDAAQASLSEKPPAVQAALPPGRWARAAREVVMGLIFTALFMTLGGKYDYVRLAEPAQQGGVNGLSFGRVLLFVQLAGFAARTKYYGVWSLTDGACVISGLGFNGYAPAAPDRKTGTSDHWAARWDRCLNVDILHIELANNWKEVLDHWNINTNIWLRNNVYKRLVPPGRKPGFSASMLTFLTSAFWHGVAPGYYLAFVLAGLFSSLAKNMRRHLRPLFFEDPRTPNPSLRRARARRAQAKTLRQKLLAVPQNDGEGKVAAAAEQSEEDVPQEVRDVVTAGQTVEASDASPTGAYSAFPLLNSPEEVPSLRQLLSDPNLFTSIGPRYTKGQLIYSALSVIATQTTLNFTVAPFLVLDWHASTAAYAAARWYGLWVALIGLGAFQLGFGRVLDRWSKQHRASKQDEIVSGESSPTGKATATASGVQPAVSNTPTTDRRQGNPLSELADQVDDETQARLEHAQEQVQAALAEKAQNAQNVQKRDQPSRA